jgi:predicted enzyme related to lactoylglutathione lyase
MSQPGANPIARPGGLTYLKIPTVEPARSAAFYEAVLGFRIDRRSADDLRFSDASGQMIGRFLIGAPPTREPGFLPYFYVDGIAAVVARVAPNGGDVVAPLHRDHELQLAEVRDPAGNRLGLWELLTAPA